MRPGGKWLPLWAPIFSNNRKFQLNRFCESIEISTSDRVGGFEILVSWRCKTIDRSFAFNILQDITLYSSNQSNICWITFSSLSSYTLSYFGWNLSTTLTKLWIGYRRRNYFNNQHTNSRLKRVSIKLVSIKKEWNAQNIKKQIAQKAGVLIKGWVCR